MNVNTGDLAVVRPACPERNLVDRFVVVHERAHTGDIIPVGQHDLRLNTDGKATWWVTAAGGDAFKLPDSPHTFDRLPIPDAWLKRIAGPGVDTTEDTTTTQDTPVAA